MDGHKVHFEVYVRKTPGAGWTLDTATESRATAIETANRLMAEGRVAAVKVTKETYDEEAREYRAVVIMKQGSADGAAKSKPQADPQPLCVTPQDLYTGHARERIGRLLEAWLERNYATPFELLHRPDLVESLEASGTELQHALQKIAIPEAHARGMSVHEMIRAFHTLIERAVDKLMSDAKKGVLPNFKKESFAKAADRLANDPERAYLLGAGVAGALADAKCWGEKLTKLLDLADEWPENGKGRALALGTIQQPLAEILEAKPGINEILGRGADLGENLAALTRLAAYDTVDKLAKREPAVAKCMPELSGLAIRLAVWLANETFLDTRAAIGRRILRELMGNRRLRPNDAAGEIDILRALGMTLTASAGNLLPLDQVQAAFTARSKMLTTGDFVEAYLGHDMSSKEEVEALIWLTENVIGPANKRKAGGWLKAVVTSLRFEKDIMAADESPAAKLATLAQLQRAVGRCGLVAEDFQPLQEKLGEIGGEIDNRAKVTQGVARANAPAIHRLTVLLKLAMGESGPLGPASVRAKSEALRLVKSDETRAELAAAPEQVQQVRDLIQQAGLAA
ncbi:hypothetical protein [uncultured Phenylobacterium sp.]|uniref:hypothetical protein n=1 Tax=uncultured Phenylobacterium sp. TaxID=349273 RepID=UPI0025F34CBD|nr:hypothetical protein [uncultured Phenylobacterium sp.]